MKKTWTSSEICEKNWWIRFQLCMGWLCESCKREVGKEMFARGGSGGRGARKCPQEHLHVPTYGVGGRLIIICGAPRPTVWRGRIRLHCFYIVIITQEIGQVW